MAVDGKQQPQTGGQASPRTARRGQQIDNTQEAQQIRRGGGFHRRNRNMIVQNASFAVQQLSESLADIFTQSEAPVETRVAVFDRNNHPTYFSGVLIAMNLQSRKDIVCYYTYLLEETNNPLPPAEYSDRDGRVDVWQPSSAVVDDDLVAAMTEYLTGRYQPGTKVYMVGACMVPADAKLNLEKRSSDVLNIAANAATAIYTNLETFVPDFSYMNLAEEVSNNSRLNIDLKFTDESEIDCVGNPIRSDITAKFTSRLTGSEKSQSHNAAANVADISTLRGYINLLWSEEHSANVFGYTNHSDPYNQQKPPYKYTACFNITSIFSEFENTLAGIGLALSTVAALENKGIWYQAFRPNLSIKAKDFDPRDIGAINYDANMENNPSGFGGPLDTKGDDFTLKDLGDAMRMLCQPGLAVAIHCPVASPESWYLNMLANAANGDQASIDAVLGAWNVLTDGHFLRRLPENAELFIDVDNYVLLGYWIDSDGKKRDIREIDMLYIANQLGDTNPEYIRKFADTYLNYDVPIQRRLESRRRMIQNVTNERAVFTGIAQVVTPSAAVMTALIEAVADTGMLTTVTTPLDSGVFNSERAAYNGRASVFRSSSRGFVNNNSMRGDGSDRSGRFGRVYRHGTYRNAGIV